MIKVKGIALLVILIFSGLAGGIARSGQKLKVEWMSPEEMGARYAISKKAIIVDVYTTWCYYCKVMDNTTWQNDSVVNYLKEKFYPVKLNAENKDPYSWMGEKFEYLPKYKVHQLAIKLLGGNMVYPSTVIIAENGDFEVLKGAFSASELEMVLKYYGDRWNENTSPEAFQKRFSGSWK